MLKKLLAALLLAASVPAVALAADTSADRAPQQEEVAAAPAADCPCCVPGAK